MVKQNECSDADFYISILDVDFSSGEVLTNILEKCKISHVKKSYYSIKTDSGVEMITTDSTLFKTMEDALEDHNSKVRRALKHIAKLNKLGKKLQKELVC